MKVREHYCVGFVNAVLLMFVLALTLGGNLIAETNQVLQSDAEDIGLSIQISNEVSSVDSADLRGKIGDLSSSDKSSQQEIFKIIEEFWEWVFAFVVVVFGGILSKKRIVELFKDLFDVVTVGTKPKGRALNGASNAGNGNVIANTSIAGNTGVININNFPNAALPNEQPLERSVSVSMKVKSISSSTREYKPKKFHFRRVMNFVMTRFKAVDVIVAKCPKSNVKICVIDDKEGRRCENGLAKMGYESVKAFPKCPDDKTLDEYSILIFDVLGVGNAAGDDGFSLAKRYKEMNPLKCVIVRSGFLTQEQRRNRGLLDAVLDKSRDLCDQVDPLLREYVIKVGDPIQMWKNARHNLIDKLGVGRLVWLEDEYVHLIKWLATEDNVLPGNWMSLVNRCLKKKVF